MNSPKSSHTTDRVCELVETTSLYFSSSSFSPLSKVQSTPPFIPSLPFQPITTQHPTITSDSSSTTQTPVVTSTPVLVPTQPRIMANRYPPLLMPTPQGAMLRDYQSKIVTFDGIGTYTIQQHTRKMTGYFELHEIDTADIQMRIFMQSFAGEVRTWFRSLSP